MDALLVAVAPLLASAIQPGAKLPIVHRPTSLSTAGLFAHVHNVSQMDYLVQASEMRDTIDMALAPVLCASPTLLAKLQHSPLQSRLIDIVHGASVQSDWLAAVVVPLLRACEHELGIRARGLCWLPLADPWSLVVLVFKVNAFPFPVDHPASPPALVMLLLVRSRGAFPTDQPRIMVRRRAGDLDEGASTTAKQRPWAPPATALETRFLTAGWANNTLAEDAFELAATTQYFVL